MANICTSLPPIERSMHSTQNARIFHFHSIVRALHFFLEVLFKNKIKILENARQSIRKFIFFLSLQKVIAQGRQWWWSVYVIYRYKVVIIFDQGWKISNDSCTWFFPEINFTTFRVHFSKPLDSRTFSNSDVSLHGMKTKIRKKLRKTRIRGKKITNFFDKCILQWILSKKKRKWTNCNGTKVEASLKK